MSTPSPEQSALASPSPSQSPDPSPSPIPGDLPLSQVSFSCRLPIHFPFDATVSKSSFIAFPSGSVTIDPAGNGGLYFDRAFSRWLPVGREAVSPDGTHYAFVTPDGQQGQSVIHIVDVATGKDRAFPLVSSAVDFGQRASVFDYSADGIYLTQAFEHIWPGVWFLDPRTGSIRQAADVERAQVIAGGALWFADVNPADPTPFSTQSSAGILPDEVGRFDLGSGSRAQWLYRPGLALDVVAVDLSGRPLIRVLVGNEPGIANPNFFLHSASELLIATNSMSQRSIFKGQIVETLSWPIADSHGVWFGSPQGIYLYSEAGGLQKVSDQPGYPANGCF
jgi:hypothetical protein